MIVGLEAGHAFAAKLREREALLPAIDALEHAAFDAAVAELVALMAVERPKAKPPAFEAPRAMARFSAAMTWASKHGISRDVPLTSFEPFLARRDAVFTQRNALAAEIEALAPYAVFAKTDTSETVYIDRDLRNQPNEDYYRQCSCNLRVAVLSARGFTTRMEAVAGGYEVFANAPAEVRAALAYWYLDDRRMLVAVGFANLKVLFSPYYPYAGFWDWPESQRKGRDHPSFEAMRANEDAHLEMNR